MLFHRNHHKVTMEPEAPAPPTARRARPSSTLSVVHRPILLSCMPSFPLAPQALIELMGYRSVCRVTYTQDTTTKGQTLCLVLGRRIVYPVGELRLSEIKWYFYL